jgi:capsular polysaccharide transport system permease protein
MKQLIKLLVTQVRNGNFSFLKQSAFKFIAKSWAQQRMLWLVVVIPTLLSVVYYGLIASDVYISESRYVVRSPDRPTANPLGMILSGGGFSNAQNDTYTVQDFVLSRDAMAALQDKLNLREAFARGDWFSSFPGLSFDSSNEHMHQYYQSRVQVRQDPITGIATLQVRAFTAQEAQLINQHLLQMGEELVNGLNERSRQDMIRFATNEVAQAESKAKEAALTLSTYRNRSGVLDVERQAAIPLQQIAKLQDELIATRSQLAQLQMLASSNPQIPVLRQRIDMLEAQIQREQSRVTGGGGSLASKAAEFQRLTLEQEFADRQLASALGSLEQARSEAQRQQLYLERIVQPNLPDAAMEPRRLRGVFTVLILGLIAWAVLVMVRAGVREHMD